MSSTTNRDVLEGFDRDFKGRARRCARYLHELDEEVLLISHIDADGLTSAAVASQALERAGIPHQTRFSKQLDVNDLDDIEVSGYGTVVFTDFGSGLLDEVLERDFHPVVADHHQPACDSEHHLNPITFEVDGSNEISGAGTAYLLARFLGELSGVDNRDLASLAVVGAVGDMQDGVDGEFEGHNSAIVAEGEEKGVLEKKKDLMLYGRQTRPLPKLFEYSTDVYVPGISDNPGGARDFLREAGIDLKSGSDWRCWTDLGDGEKSSVMNLFFEKCMERGVSPTKINGLVGYTYVLSGETMGSELRDASEFSTLLNSTARYDRADVGFKVCKGDRDDALVEARELLMNHRRNIREGIDYVESTGVTKLEEIQYFDAGSEIQDTIVGIIAGMSYSASGVSKSKPIIAFADTDDDKLDIEGGEKKVSGRATKRLVERGVDLAELMENCAEKVSGVGGGHDIAAGATVPEARIDEFLEYADAMVAEQK
ncbi:MAG: DHHA1 domain-containing protein [Halobacteria archaeon]